MVSSERGYTPTKNCRIIFRPPHLGSRTILDRKDVGSILIFNIENELTQKSYSNTTGAP